ncbi:oligopeptide ABC transporter permease [Tepidibacillus infernus]|uniref:oligopeptide ABC transporter permease n=1 Tax=Tepidibacillus TaxID=1494427 RepID=UPI000852D302|nr:oligopeptide ABC transporter permease [Tepidibacillus sp. HK-1]GBF11137.1 oligopeptide transport system permease protein OppC [Tepidibacillus sp. HK-1]
MEPVVTQRQNLQSGPKVPKSPSPWTIARRKFFRNKLAIAGLIFIFIVVTISFLAPYITTYDPTRVDIKSIAKPPSTDHWFGTDKGGRDVFTRLLYGGRISLTIGFSITFFVVLIGTIIGSIAGYFGGRIDSLLMRFTDFILVFPFLIFVIVLNSIFTESGVITLIFTISVLSWGGTARMVRSKVLAEKENEYILSAVSIGCSPTKVILRHLIPNVLSTVIVQATILLAAMIVVETGLTFLGFGVPANIPSWGNMISDARSPDVIQNKPWIWLPPGLVLTLTILSINFVGEGLKDAFNPKSAR